MLAAVHVHYGTLSGGLHDDDQICRAGRGRDACACAARRCADLARGGEGRAGVGVGQGSEHPYQEFTLKNGLRVIVHTDRKAPVVAVSVWYDVGSKHEPQGSTASRICSNI